AKMCGTPEKTRDGPAPSQGQIPRISAVSIDYLGEREKNKWCQKRHHSGVITTCICRLISDLSQTIYTSIYTALAGNRRIVPRIGRSITRHLRLPEGPTHIEPILVLLLQ